MNQRADGQGGERKEFWMIFFPFSMKFGGAWRVGIPIHVPRRGRPSKLPQISSTICLVVIKPIGRWGGMRCKVKKQPVANIVRATIVIKCETK